METFFSKRTEWDLRSNPLTRKLQEREVQGRATIDMTRSNPTQCAIMCPEEAISRLLVQPESFRYHPDPKGLLAARKAIAMYYRAQHISVNPEHIFLTSSTSESYSFLLR
ncbi:MAG: pyridoxal phosphate-dependent aminotransferase, partial [Chlamydiota bacterium]|nr:pyridoxal phosphate-dependent aminotransferase [Chlamydiota bacterium]